MRRILAALALLISILAFGSVAEAQFLFEASKPRTGGLSDPPKPVKAQVQEAIQAAAELSGEGESASGTIPPAAPRPLPPTSAPPIEPPHFPAAKAEEPPLPEAAARDGVAIGNRGAAMQAAPPPAAPPAMMTPAPTPRPVQVIVPGKPPSAITTANPGAASSSPPPIRVRVGGAEPLAKLASLQGEIPKENLAVPLNKTSQILLSQPIRDIIVGNPEVADVVVRSTEQVFVHGKAVGDTNLFLLDVNGNVVRRIEVSVQLEVESLRQLLTQLLPNDPIEVSSIGDNIILSGNVRSDGVAGQARSVARRYVKKEENIVSLLKVRTEQQVLIQVRVAEVQKAVLKELGVSNTLANVGMGAVFADQGVMSATTTAVGLGTDIATQLNVRGVINNLSSVFRFLEKQGLVKNLAEPNLMAVSGELANMLAGGEYPIPVPDKDGIKIEYKPFGVGLSFLPVVLDNGRISLKLSTEVSALSATNDVQIPVTGGSVRVKSFTVRRANSTVELPSGGSIMIAGLLQNDVVSSLNGMPGLMDIPILGTLFSSSSFQRQETELVILVSAILVRPNDPKSLSTPTDGHVISSDFDRYFMVKIQDTYVKRPVDNRAPSGPQGSIGYIVD
jgi:pilus assembly protein CpaC